LGYYVLANKAITALPFVIKEREGKERKGKERKGKERL